MISRLEKLKQDKNTWNVAANMLAVFGVKGGSLLVALFTTPAYITYFSDDTILGVWFTVLSVLAWLLNFDVGIGNGLRNKLVEALGTNDADECRRYVSSAYILLSILAAGILVVGSILLEYLPWNRLLGVGVEAIERQVLLTAIRVVFISIILQFVLRLITSISFAMQHSYVSNLLNLCTNIAMLSYASMANRLGFNGRIVNLAWAYLMAVNVPMLAATVILFATKFRNLVPKIRYFSMKHARATLKLGGVFLYLQLVTMLINNSSEFPISYLLGAEQVVEFQLYYKLFHSMSTIVAISIVPMWSAITKAMVEKRYQWLKKVIYFMFGLVAASGVIEFLLIPLLPVIFPIWLGENAREVNFAAGILFAIYGTLFTWQHICRYISNGLGKLKTQAICLTLGVVISYASATALSRIWEHYLAITVGAIAGYLPLCIAQTIWTLRFCRKLGSTDECK